MKNNTTKPEETNIVVQGSQNKDNCCRVCGSDAKKSTAFVQDSLKTETDNIRQQDKLATRRVECKKCKNCGHSWQ